MLHRFFCIALAAVLVSLLASGCGDRNKIAPPSARAELTARLFDALQFHRYDDALAIIDKLLAIDPDDVELMEMRSRVITSACTVKVQQFVDQNQLDKALQTVVTARKNNPVLPQLIALEEEIRGLIALRDAANVLAAAKTIPELAAALEKIAPLAAKYPQAKALHRDIDTRRKELERFRAEAQQVQEKSDSSNPVIPAESTGEK